MNVSESLFARQKKRDQQRRWRKRKADSAQNELGSSLTIHLSPEEVAILDHIAMADYASRPSNRKGVRDETPPSRSRAIRMLIRQYRTAFGPSDERISEISQMRAALGTFWVAERCWRSTSHERRRELDETGEWAVNQPSPPWNTTPD